MKSNLFLKELFFVFLPFLASAQNHCEYVNVGCDEQNQSVIFDQSFTPDDPIIVNVILSPATQTHELTFDGNYLWVGSALDSMLHQISPIDGSIISSIKTLINRPHGLAFDGEYLWVADDETGIIHKVNPSNGNSLFSFDAPFQGYLGGLAYDGENLWHVDADADSIYVINTNGEVLSSQKLGLYLPIALTFAGPDLWVGDNNVHLLYKVDTTSFNFLDTIRAPRTFPNGLAFDGQYLWVSENSSSGGTDSIYQLDIGLPPVSTKIVTDESIVEVFPNPTSNTFLVKVKAENKNQISRIAITSLDGKVIFQAILEDKYLDSYEISLADQSPGIYFCQIIIDDQVLVKKIIKN